MITLLLGFVFGFLVGGVFVITGFTDRIKKGQTPYVVDDEIMWKKE